MKFNKKQRIGVIVLITIIALLQFVILNLHEYSSNNISEERNVELDYYNKVIDSLKDSSKKSTHKYFKFNPNKLSYNSWSYLGLTTDQLYKLDSFRAKNTFSTLQEVKSILHLNDSIFNVIDTLMYFPKAYVRYSSKQKKKIKYYRFNPNKLSTEGWMNLGFSKKQSEVISNYIKVRGGIKKKEELKDIFVINKEKYSKLEPYIDIPKLATVPEKAVVTLNTATVDDFKKIKGIGDVYSKIIVDYRTKLGGFKFYYQLKEINIVDSALYVAIKKQFPLSKDYKVRKLNINKATLEGLQNHPYISWRLANSIVDFRTNFRDFKSLDELKNIEVISDAYFNKIKLYLTLE